MLERLGVVRLFARVMFRLLWTAYTSQEELSISEPVGACIKPVCMFFLGTIRSCERLSAFSPHPFVSLPLPLAVLQANELSPRCMYNFPKRRVRPSTADLHLKISGSEPEGKERQERVDSQAVVRTDRRGLCAR